MGSTPTQTAQVPARTKLGGVTLAGDAQFGDLPAYELAVDPAVDEYGATTFRIRGMQVVAYLFPDDKITDTRRLLLVDELGGHAVIVDTRIPGAVIGADLIAEGMLRGYALANGVTPATGPDPAKDPSTGDWWTCSLHGGAITQDCACTPPRGLGDLDKAAKALDGHLWGADRPRNSVRALRDVALATVEAYHGIQRCEHCKKPRKVEGDPALCRDCLIPF